MDAVFDNGSELIDIPYYSGYYVSDGDLLLCGYPGYTNVLIARNNGDSTWEEFDMTEDSHVTVTLHEKGKYKDFEDANNLVYSTDREDFSSDQVFANFRETGGTGLASGLIFRSASPCDNDYNRASYVDGFAEDTGIRFVINLSDSSAEYEESAGKPDFDSPYYAALVEDGDVLFLDLGANYHDDGYKQILAEALLTMSEHEGPCLIHCVEGKDRTGFVCALLLALAGASYEEILSDYMITYENYYGLTKESDSEKYDIMQEKAKAFLYTMCDAEKGTPLETLDLQEGARNYLRQGGLSDEEIDRIEAYLHGE